MNLTVTVDEIALDSIVGEVYAYDPEADERHTRPQTLADLIAAQFVERLVTVPGYQVLAQEVTKARSALIRERIAAQIEDELTKPIRPTNTWGEATGAPTTLRAEISRIAADAVKVTTPSNRNREESALEKLIRTEIGVALAKELAGFVADEKAKVVAAVRAKAAELIATAVKEGVGR